jgi:Sulfotransferase family.
MKPSSMRNINWVFFGVTLLIIIVALYTAFELNVLDDRISQDTTGDQSSLAPALQRKGTPTPNDADEENTSQSGQISVDLSSNVSDCDDFDHGDVSSLDNVTSIFNCGSESGTCSWYHPARFLDKYCGIGKEFFSDVEYMKELYDSRQLWLSGPPIVIPWASIKPENMKPNPYRPGPWPHHNLSMTHVHKTGGTSLVTAFGSVLSKGARGKRHLVYMPGRKKVVPTVEKMNLRSRIKGMNHTFREPPPTKIYTASFKEASKFLDGATKYKKPDEWRESDHTLFAVVRDPVDRFISAIGQATGAYGSSQNDIGQQLLDECLKDSSRETLRCFIELMHTNSTWIEVHFTPMVLEISFATIYKDIPVAVFPFTQVPNLLLELGSNPAIKKKDGHKSGYRKSAVLTNMTAADYDDDMLLRLCQVYKMDAMFMKHLGMSTKCDKVIDLL